MKKTVRYFRKAWETWQIVAMQLGWRKSFESGRPVDALGMPIPWHTYPAIEFLNTLNYAGRRVFEYGCGNSSIFWASRVNEIFAVENDPNWAAAMRNLDVPGLTIIQAQVREEYVNSPKNLGGRFDVVIIDGRWRRACANIACDVVKDGGMIIFDNADWYPDACSDLRSRGWFQVDFSGLGPINPYAWTTAIFFKFDMPFERLENVRPTGGASPTWP